MSAKVGGCQLLNYESFLPNDQTIAQFPLEELNLRVREYCRGFGLGSLEQRAVFKKVYSYLEERKIKAIEIVPRRKGSKEVSVDIPPVIIVYNELWSVQSMPIKEAAKYYGISLTALKKACRKMEIRTWGYRFWDSISEDKKPKKVLNAANVEVLQQEAIPPQTAEKASMSFSSHLAACRQLPKQPGEFYRIGNEQEASYQESWEKQAVSHTLSSLSQIHQRLAEEAFLQDLQAMPILQRQESFDSGRHNMSFLQENWQGNLQESWQVGELGHPLNAQGLTQTTSPNAFQQQGADAANFSPMDPPTLHENRDVDKIFNMPLG